MCATFAGVWVYAAGVVIAVITFASPLPAILAADKTKDLKVSSCCVSGLYISVSVDCYACVWQTGIHHRGTTSSQLHASTSTSSVRCIAPG